jgi:hypothetical protein
MTETEVQPTCRKCKHREPRPGSRTCEICSSHEAEYMREKRIRAKEEGVCQFCFRTKVDLPGHYYCKHCIGPLNERIKVHMEKVAALDRRRKARLEAKRQAAIRRLSGETT